MSVDIEFEEFLRTRTRAVIHERFIVSPYLGQQIYDEETEMLRAQMRAANHERKSA
ncbi:hypothetical protein [Subtercola endophyticus]|uniref:hypothetical protein n=1 Tax=Subtercola endophyticus TaxID=2895559 RepID=UPI001E415AAF|nr:hypothetical protein [Subtercola endophyticus]UFS59497.1 hypothetical protein LQ955_01465 [Subtercola endophyticus]